MSKRCQQFHWQHRCMKDEGHGGMHKVLMDNGDYHMWDVISKAAEIRPLDSMIGRLDRLLSEFLVHCQREDIDEADRQTLKHHADDLVGVGKRALEILAKEYMIEMRLP